MTFVWQQCSFVWHLIVQLFSIWVWMAEKLCPILSWGADLDAIREFIDRVGFFHKFEVFNVTGGI